MTFSRNIYESTPNNTIIREQKQINKRSIYDIYASKFIFGIKILLLLIFFIFSCGLAFFAGTKYPETQVIYKTPLKVDNIEKQLDKSKENKSQTISEWSESTELNTYGIDKSEICKIIQVMSFAQYKGSETIKKSLEKSLSILNIKFTVPENFKDLPEDVNINEWINRNTNLGVIDTSNLQKLTEQLETKNMQYMSLESSKTDVSKSTKEQLKQEFQNCIDTIITEIRKIEK